MTTPSPTSWTLRLKSHKTTVLLHVNPLTTFSTIKSTLYTALQETSLKDPDTGSVIQLPDSPSDIQLGRPNNINDPRGGFSLGEWEYTPEDDDVEGDEDSGKGKGKAKEGEKKVKARPKKDEGELATPANIKDCPKGAGLRDGAVLAFRWKGDKSAWRDEEEYDDISADPETGKEPDMWGVRIATFEDSYGVENVGDVGVGGEFEG